MDASVKDVWSGSAGTTTTAAFAPAATSDLPRLPRQFLGRGVERSLRRVAEQHNAVHDKPGQRADVRALRAVYRRGARAFVAGRKPGTSRRQHAMTRVRAHLHLLSTGRRPHARYTGDDDLLPARHPLAPKDRKVALGWLLTAEGSEAERRARGAT